MGKSVSLNDFIEAVNDIELTPECGSQKDYKIPDRFSQADVFTNVIHMYVY